MKIIKIIFVLSIIISLIFYIVNTDLHLVKLSLKHVGWNFCWLLLVTIIAYLFGTLAWRYCLGPNKNSVNIIKLFWIRSIGETVSLFNPSSIIGGDMLKVELLKSSIERKTVINSVVISRFLMIISQVSMFLLASFILFSQIGDAFKNIIWTTLTILILFFVLLYLAFCIYKMKSISRLQLFANRNDSSLGKIISGIKNTFKQTVHFYHTEKTALLLSFFFFCLHWLIGSMEFFLILKFLNVNANIIHGLLIDMGVIFFKSAGAFIPAQIGIEEYGNQFMLNLVGMSGASLWLSASILRRMRQLLWFALSGLSYFILYRKTLQVQTA
ncbi:lysylphosphatidylglycerol synthase domain-containing protein [Olivibacter domesticus]|uniref:Lysylphosphatidylglycerol synthase TM region n=1 Tax=Olivibacter domesticus TaxID=407022 RepID=A0A1H7PZR1_OLID1|nr:lysylphosphatidylglycerol synthase domain-containing protein [Olivibacter domesticus]SEL40958.1 Lysylphosphatidylglycerol synthase TM region [Olivibacter domesticus]